VQTIDPEKDYPFPEAARLIPSPLTRSGCISANTLHRWRKLGLLRARVVRFGKRPVWVLSGREMLRLLRLRLDRQPLGAPTSAEPRTTETRGLTGNKHSGREPDHERHRQVILLRAQGVTLAAIGHRLGVTRQAVFAMLRRLSSAPWVAQ
jgi:hypothetical protein